LTRWWIHFVVADSLIATTYRVVSASLCILSQKTVCCTHQDFTRKMTTMHWPQWGVCAVCWSVIVQLSSYLSLYSRWVWSFLNDRHTETSSIIIIIIIIHSCFQRGYLSRDNLFHSCLNSHKFFTFCVNSFPSLICISSLSLSLCIVVGLLSGCIFIFKTLNGILL
jgi:hypothetical protein